MGIETQENADNYSDCVEPQISYKTQKTGCVFDVSPENLLYNTVLKVSYVARIFTKIQNDSKVPETENARNLFGMVWNGRCWEFQNAEGEKKVLTGTKRQIDKIECQVYSFT